MNDTARARHRFTERIGPSPRVLQQVREALSRIDPDDFGSRNLIGAALKAALGDSGALIYMQWRSLDGQDAALEWQDIETVPGVGINKLFELARDCGWQWQKPPITVEDFCAYLPGNNFIFIPTGELWP